jgi:hypothetical protein
VRVDWDGNRFGRIGDDNRLHTFVNVYVRRRDLEDWFAQAAARKGTPSETLAAEVSPTNETSPPISPSVAKGKKLDKVKAYIAETFPDGIPAGVTDKTIARDTGTSERTVRRARRGL